MNDEEDVSLTLEEAYWRHYAADEDSGKISFEELDAAPYVRQPRLPGRVVAVILPFKRQKPTMS